MKLMCSAVTSSAATTRSPSFSRSSSSTTMTNLPALKSAIASGTVARVMVRRSLPAEVSGDVPRDDVGFEIDDRASFVPAGDRSFKRVGYESHFEGAGGLVHLGHGEADAIDRDGSFDGHKPRQAGGQLDGHFAPGGGRSDRFDFCRGVDMTLNEVTVQQRGGTERQLEVHFHTWFESAEVCAAQSFGDDVSEEDRSCLLHDRKAASIDGDAAADLQAARDPRVID